MTPTTGIDQPLPDGALGRPMVALDVGGTAIKAGIVTDRSVVVGVTSGPVDAHATADVILDVVTAVIDDRLTDLSARFGRGPASDEATSVAVAFPGPFDYPAGVPWLDHKYEALRGRRLGPELVTRLRYPVAGIGFVNDAAAAGAGAVRQLGADGDGTVLVVTLGTGMGSALFDDGRLVEKRGGIVVADLWARDVAGTPADRRYSATGLAMTLGVEPAQLPATMAAVEAGIDGVSRARLLDWADDFGRFLASLVEPLAVDRIVVGGGAAGALGLFGPTLERAVSVPVEPVPDATTAPLLGAAILVLGR